MNFYKQIHLVYHVCRVLKSTHLKNIFLNLGSPSPRPKKKRKTKNHSSTSTTSLNIHQKPDQQGIRFETEPIEKFRGRMLTDMRPKSVIRRDGQLQSTKKHPSYFPDRNNQHFLRLLVCYFSL